jgi:hypothetical protein
MRWLRLYLLLALCGSAVTYEHDRTPRPVKTKEDAQPWLKPCHTLVVDPHKSQMRSVPCDARILDAPVLN